MTKKKKKSTDEEKIEIFKEIENLAKELGFKGPVGLKNTLWAHIEEIRSLKEEIKKLRKIFSDSFKEVEIQKAEILEIYLRIKETGQDILNAVLKISDLFNENIKKENEKIE